MSTTDTDGSAHLPANATDLPESVRARLVSLVAALLPDVARLSPQLRMVASFAAGRRAKRGAAAILAALDDPEERERIGRAVRTPYDLAAVAADGLPKDADPAEVAAVAWLRRPDHAEVAYAAALAGLAEPSAPAESAELARLRRRVEQLDQEVRDERSAKKARVEEVKEENRTLRRKLGETRVALTAAQERVAEAEEECAALRSRVEGGERATEKEIRRLRAEVERLGAAENAERRAVRLERDEASMRTRVLLETVLDAAAGLRRELALPAATRTPGERAEQTLAPESEGGSTSALRVTTGAMLEQLLAMPRVRLLIDGYNVSKSVWPESSLEAQRVRLLRAITPLVARSNAETTVVFDAAQVTSRPVVAAPRGVRVLFSPQGVIADDVIRELVAAEPRGRVVLVVSDDRAVSVDVTRAGARSVSVTAFHQLTDQR
ncbi:NYN domain-containing protein [Nocardioides insulae]|uniref:NYN domain-containing protein n=1 Tax=Nocardioides insulae TaxID=394734 RepID=UPI0003F70EF3|nr:NYN domain-containing protein [Nocardioides insulae]